MIVRPHGPRTKVWPNGVPSVGQTASHTRSYTYDDVKLFDAISGDRNPFHYDHEFANASPLNGLCLQSGVFTSIFNRILSEQIPGPWTFFLEVNWSYRMPARLNEPITGRIEVAEVRTDKPIARLMSEILTEDGEFVLEGTILTYTFADTRI